MLICAFGSQHLLFMLHVSTCLYLVALVGCYGSRIFWDFGMVYFYIAIVYFILLFYIVVIVYFDIAIANFTLFVSYWGRYFEMLHIQE